MSSQLNRYTLSITPTARRQLAETLPEVVALAAYEFIVGLLLDTPTVSESDCMHRWRTVTAHAGEPTA